MNFKYIGNLLMILVGFCFLGLAVFITVKIISDDFLDIPIIGQLLFPIPFYMLGYLFSMSSYCRIQYATVEKGKNVILCGAKKKLIITDTTTKTEKTIKPENVRAVEIYTSWNTNPFSSDLGYSKLILNDSSIIIITQKMLHELHIEKLFKKKITKEKSRFMNRLR
jgi:hypothetical protein